MECAHRAREDDTAPVGFLEYVYKYTYMATKTITITEATYEKLLAHKRDDESFSDVITRLATAAVDPRDSAGAYRGLGEAVEAARAEYESDLAERTHELPR